jgi:DNA adenine methylase
MEPFLKWAGGKRWFIKNYSDLLPKENEYKKYLEPFLGGGAMFFHLKPQKAILNDVNSELINVYEQMKCNWENINLELVKLNEIHNKELYYQVRNSVPANEIERAIRFIYLNRTCWNGLYRVNKKNEFNVPIGTKDKVILEADNFSLTSKTLKKAKLLSEDFESVIKKGRRDDFIFVDPPYTVKHNKNGFIKYNENLFSWDDQVRLKKSLVKAIDKGVKVLILNANHDSIKDLYYGVGEFKKVTRASVISGNSENRGIYEELVIKCY